MVFGKRHPSLRLVSQGQGILSQDSVLSGDLTLASLDEVERTEHGQVKRIVAELSPGAAVIGVARGEQSWDIRPVILIPKESCPSIMRMLGPDVSLSVTISTRVQEIFERITRQAELSSHILDWGVYDGQLWYRREVATKTLQKTLLDSELFTLSQALTLSKSIVREVSLWHKIGVVHGHICASNISCESEAKVTLLDGGIGLGVMQAALQRGKIVFGDAGALLRSFAPESPQGESSIFASDVYCLGLTLLSLFQRVEENLFPQELPHADARPLVLTALHQLFTRMISLDPKMRPSLPEVQNQLEQYAPTFKVSMRHESQRGFQGLGQQAVELFGAPPVSGRMIYPTGVQGNTSTVVHQEPIVFAHPGLAGLQQIPGGVSPVQMPVTHAFPSVVTPVPHVAPAVEPHFPVAPKPIAAPSTSSQFSQAATSTITQESESDHESKPDRVGRFLVWATFLVVLSGGAYVYSSKMNRAVPAPLGADLRFQWQSQRRSLMLPVALAALDSTHPNEQAANLIIDSALHEGNTSEGVDVGLLRIAFDRRWESELKPTDRRMALALALSGLLDDQIPDDLPSLSSVHPGVLLALTASAGERASKLLKNIPAENLVALPVPFKAAFKMLVQAKPKLSCGDKMVQRLARFGTLGVFEPREVFDFLKEDFEIRLKALALLASGDDAQASGLLDTLINSPNSPLQQDVLKWAKERNLLKWEEIESSSQLLILSGSPPAEELSARNLTYLLTHPSPALRQYALRKAIDTMAFNHPAARIAIEQVIAQPERFTANGTYLLANLLAKPESASPEKIQEWLTEAPPQSLVEVLLLGSVGQPKETRLDFELFSYLRDRDWNPSSEVVIKLTKHPEKLTRLFAYSKVYELPDATLARATLETALKDEKDQDFQRQLRVMIESLK